MYNLKSIIMNRKLKKYRALFWRMINFPKNILVYLIENFSKSQIAIFIFVILFLIFIFSAGFNVWFSSFLNLGDFYQNIVAETFGVIFEAFLILYVIKLWIDVENKNKRKNEEEQFIKKIEENISNNCLNLGIVISDIVISKDKYVQIGVGSSFNYRSNEQILDEIEKSILFAKFNITTFGNSTRTVNVNKYVGQMNKIESCISAIKTALTKGFAEKYDNLHIVDMFKEIKYYIIGDQKTNNHYYNISHMIQQDEIDNGNVLKIIYLVENSVYRRIISNDAFENPKIVFNTLYGDLLFYINTKLMIEAAEFDLLNDFDYVDLEEMREQYYGFEKKYGKEPEKHIYNLMDKTITFYNIGKIGISNNYVNRILLDVINFINEDRSEAREKMYSKKGYWYFMGVTRLAENTSNKEYNKSFHKKYGVFENPGNSSIMRSMLEKSIMNACRHIALGRLFYVKNMPFGDVRCMYICVSTMSVHAMDNWRKANMI